MPKKKPSAVEVSEAVRRIEEVQGNKKALVSVQDGPGGSVLHSAISHWSHTITAQSGLTLVTMLLKAGADPSTYNLDGQLPHSRLKKILKSQRVPPAEMPLWKLAIKQLAAKNRKRSRNKHKHRQKKKN
jgi:hypothetical protein